MVLMRYNIYQVESRLPPNTRQEAGLRQSMYATSIIQLLFLRDFTVRLNHLGNDNTNNVKLINSKFSKKFKTVAQKGKFYFYLFIQYISSLKKKSIYYFIVKKDKMYN